MTDLSKEQKRALLDKVKGAWGEVSQWSAGQISEVKNILGK